MLRRLLFLFAVLLVALGVTTTAAGAKTAPVPGGLDPHARVLRVDQNGTIRAAAAFGRCAVSGVVCKPEEQPGTCTNQTDQNTAPATIRVLTGSTASSIKVVDFRTYVKTVLPNEWPATWDGDALKAGAVAIKTYGWYWVTHRYGGYVGTASPSTCFDVTDDQNFQRYTGPYPPTARSNTVVDQTWPVAIRRDGQIIQSSFQDVLVSKTEGCGEGRNGMVMSQYGSQACNEVNDGNNGYRYNVILRLYYGDDIDLSTTAQLRSQQDFTFTARSTGATFNSGRWHISDGYPTTFFFGGKGDVPFTATDGDGFATAAIWRPSIGTFAVTDTLHRTVQRVPFGGAADLPVPAHYDGLTAPTRLAVFRPRNGTWYFATDTGAVASSVYWGGNGDIPVPGRWLSATTDTIAVFRPSNGTWGIRGGAMTHFGGKGDIPVPADYNGDGRTDLAIYRPANHSFYVSGQQPVSWGLAGDVPVTGDFTGDGKADLAVFRATTGFIYVRNGPSIDVNGGTPLGLAPYRG